MTEEIKDIVKEASEAIEINKEVINPTILSQVVSKQKTASYKMKRTKMLTVWQVLLSIFTIKITKEKSLPKPAEIFPRRTIQQN
jgi:hypothetical protein